ncbi:Pycsar system effector family protein [Streptomyces sp. NRRL S-1521]|uniref:Pycsar system effector family protein n=1 Tax=Streptomyces sp. NRRL S-1521 TaxID=1609100 RepID=UPI000A561A4F
MNATGPADRPDASPDAALPPGVGVAERLLADLRAEIARADGKASVLVAALGMTAGVFSGLLIGRDWSPAALSGLGAALWWAGAASLTLSLSALLLAVLPRFDRGTWRPGQPLAYFGDIREAARAGRLRSALVATERDPATGLTTALTDMSRIVARKHEWIRAGLLAFCAGTLLLPASLLIG